jgi:hypothetical protein
MGDNWKHDEQLRKEIGPNDVGPGGSPILLASPADLTQRSRNSWIVDGRSGGLVRGHSHEADNTALFGRTIKNI